MANIFDSSKKRAVRLLREWLLWAEEWILPPVCMHCGKRRYGGLPLCRGCLRVVRMNLVWDEEVFPQSWIHPLFCMSPQLLSLIHGLKYRHYRRHVRFLCSYLRYRPCFTEALKRPDLIIPVPLHPARQRERGYNQSELIAGEVKGRFGVSWTEKAMRRIRFTKTQTRLGVEERSSNLADTFWCDPERVMGKKILLIDDVCTTGNTLTHCRDELLRAGAISVEAFVLAWVERYWAISG
jgi:ComF family protein